MGLWVRNEKKLIMQCSKEIWKDVRAVRSASTTQEPRRALRITRLLFEILLLCLRSHGSSANRRKIVRKSTKIQPRPTQHRRKIGLEPFWAPKAVSGTRPDALGTVFERPNAAPKPILGRRGRAQNGQEMSKSFPGPPENALRLSGWAVQAPVEH